MTDAGREECYGPDPRSLCQLMNWCSSQCPARRKLLTLRYSQLSASDFPRNSQILWRSVYYFTLRYVFVNSNHLKRGPLTLQHIAGHRALLKGPQKFLIDTFLGQNGRRTFHFSAFIVAVYVTFPTTKRQRELTQPDEQQSLHAVNGRPQTRWLRGGHSAPSWIETTEPAAAVGNQPTANENSRM